jgi:hypothetical protein
MQRIHWTESQAIADAGSIILRAAVETLRIRQLDQR